jgi:hypothetical protein
MENWIKADEKLPEREAVVIIYTRGVVSVGYYLQEYLGNSLWDFMDGEAAYGVTHWMPLPEAPSGN